MAKKEYEDLYPTEEEEKISTSKKYHTTKMVEKKSDPPKKTKEEEIIDKLNNAISLLGRNPRNRREVTKLISEAIQLLKNK